MKKFRSFTAIFLALCLSVGMLFTIAVSAATSEEDEELFNLLQIFDVDDETYTNYDQLYAESLPVEYSKTDNPGYTALGGITASGVGADISGSDTDNSYAKRFSEYLGLGDKYINASSNKITDFEKLNQYFSGTTVKQSIYKADIITFQLDSSMIISASINSIAQLNYTPDWSKYVQDPEFSQVLEDYRSEYTERYGNAAARALECLLFQSVACAFETMSSVEKIRELNSKATIIVLGLYNPLSGLKLTTNNKTVLVDEFLGAAIDSCNVFLLDRTMKMSNVAFVDISDTHTPGFDGLTLNLDDGISNEDWTNIQSKPESQHADADGHTDIFQQLAATTQHHVVHVLDDGTVSKKPGCTTTGEMLHKCISPNCTYTETKVIAPSGHVSDKYIDNQDGTCQRAGTLSGVCSVCKKGFTIDNPAGPVDHSYGDNGLCIYCKQPENALAPGDVVAIVLGSLAAACGGAAFGLSYYQQKIVKTKEILDVNKEISVDEQEKHTTDANEGAEAVEQAKKEEESTASDATVEEKEEN